MNEKKYGQDPITEVITEFYFEESQNWDQTSPGVMYEKLRQDFPTKKTKNVTVQHDSGTSQIQRLQFWSKDNKSIIQTNKDFVCINRQKPYPKWPEYKEQVNTGVDAYIESVDQEQKVKHIALRFFNEIAIPKDDINNLKDYFNLYIHSNNKEYSNMNGFVVGFTVTPDKERKLQHKFRLNTHIPDVGDNKCALLLLLECEEQFTSGIKKEEALDKTNEYHDSIKQMFEDSITDKTREIFGRP